MSDIEKRIAELDALIEPLEKRLLRARAFVFVPGRHLLVHQERPSFEDGHDDHKHNSRCHEANEDRMLDFEDGQKRFEHAR